jgi:hypothetical protein
MEARWDAGTVSDSLHIALNQTAILYLSESSVHVWAIVSGKDRLFLGQVLQGEPLKFKELGGERNKTGCSLIAHGTSLYIPLIQRYICQCVVYRSIPLPTDITDA